MIIERRHSKNLSFLGLNINVYETSEYEVYLSPQTNIRGHLIVFEIKTITLFCSIARFTSFITSRMIKFCFWVIGFIWMK